MIRIYPEHFFIYLKNKFSSYRAKRSTDNLNKLWRGEKEKEIDLKLIREYHIEKCKAGAIHVVDDGTWSDLNMDTFFRKMDRCASAIGSQYLYHLLHKYETDPKKLDRRYNEYQLFIGDKPLREKIQKPMLRLNRSGACYLVDLFFSDLPKKPWYYFLFILSSLILLSSIIAMFFNGVFILAVLFFGVTNLLIHALYTPKISGYIPDLSVLSHMLGIVVRLSKIEGFPQLAALERLKMHCRYASKFNKKFGWLVVDKYILNELAVSVYAYLNHFFLMELILFFFCINEIKGKQKLLIEMYENIASLDAGISISSYLNSVSKYCKPVFNEKKSIVLIDAFHPLIEEPVTNSFSLENKSCLITGSNMAGKTTFIKTIGINIILARTLDICMAGSANIPLVQVKTSIKRQDDLNGKKSYYYKEIESILDFINISKNGDQFIFLIDEIFRGTNTCERLSSATAVLKYLSGKNINMVTTHDLELQNYLSDKFEIFHFMERIENNEHFFDYLIKPGSCQSRNAIRLLEMKGYPKSIIREAYKLSKTDFVPLENQTVASLGYHLNIKTEGEKNGEVLYSRRS